MRESRKEYIWNGVHRNFLGTCLEKWFDMAKKFEKNDKITKYPDFYAIMILLHLL